jgi:hypothetical protein
LLHEQPCGESAQSNSNTDCRINSSRFSVCSTRVACCKIEGFDVPICRGTGPFSIATEEKSKSSICGLRMNVDSFEGSEMQVLPSAGPPGDKRTSLDCSVFHGRIGLCHRRVKRLSEQSHLRPQSSWAVLLVSRCDQPHTGRGPDNRMTKRRPTKDTFPPYGR